MEWVNTNVYDFKNQLKNGPTTLYMWTYADGLHNEDLLHPLGTVVSNPNFHQATALTITFYRFDKLFLNIFITKINMNYV